MEVLLMDNDPHPIKRRNTITSLAKAGTGFFSGLKNKASNKIQNIKEKRRNRGSMAGVDMDDMMFEDEDLPGRSMSTNEDPRAKKILGALK